MNLPPTRRLAAFVEPRIDETRVDRAWSAVSSRPARAWPSRRAVAMPAVILAAAAAVLFFLVRAKPPVSAVAGMVVESGAGQTVTLAEGSRAALYEGARLRWDRIQADRIEATVERGRVGFDVHHSEARAFVVHAAGVDVLDRGTRFTVDVEGDGVSVSVEDGRVAIARAGAPPTELWRGERWTSGATARAPVEPASSPVSPTVAAGAPSPKHDVRPTTSAEVTSRAASSEPRSATAQELLQLGNEARLAGRPKDAAASFDHLRRRFRNDPRAGLAAFELGRLRLDALGDPAGAAEALTDAVALAPSAPFRQDADARLVEALDQMHDPRCFAARQAYLARYPNGLHAAIVATRCP